MKNDSSTAVRSEPTDWTIERCQRWGQFWEILAVIILAASIGLAFFKYDSSWLLLALLGFITALIPIYFAVVLASRIDTETRRRSEDVRYVLTEKRLKTLEIVEAPQDALAALKALRSYRPDNKELTEGELLVGLRRELGAARTDELKGLICKYLRLDKLDRAVAEQE